MSNKLHSTPQSPYASNKRGPVEASILDYVLSVHGAQCSNRASLIALLVHSELLSRGARPIDTTTPTAVLSASCFNEDPVRISYTLISRPKSDTLATPCSQLQVSVAETDTHIFISVTDTTTDKFGHLELSGIEHVSLDSVKNSTYKDPNAVFPQLNELLDCFEENLWKPVLPSPPFCRSTDTDCKRNKKDSQPDSDDFQNQPQMPFPGTCSGTKPSVGTLLPGYGRSDLDPLASIRGPSVSGGMILDPRHIIPDSGSGSGSFIGGPDVLPPGAVPPGARFDPFGPGMGPLRPHPSGGRRHIPDPDHAMPPGFDNFYM
ncbi:Proteasome inhibitor PI31 subunit [Schistosoma japonicum]|uniref:Proteasome inhibitor PI31 subunit n=1 Tax=Schistosoma japonicum TaxID=6182 RepID=A0A4Z2DSZ4_SCHJA|nr:Proteasome inhibitor PI31 subunit [Schistosoma japonicum]